MEKIAIVNNEAIELFKAGSGGNQAVTLLTELLGNLKTILLNTSEEEEEEEEEEQDSCDGMMDDSSSDAACDESAALHMAESLPAVPVSRSCNFVYNKAFKLSPKLAECHRRDASTPHVFTACVIYNLAVMHQNLGLILGGVTEMTNNNDAAMMYLEKAERLYTMGLKILDGCNADNMTVRAAKAVSLNNLAQIYGDQGDTEQAEACLTRVYFLVGVASSATDQQYDHHSASSSFQYGFSSEDYDGILTNILSLIPATTAAAA